MPRLVNSYPGFIRLVSDGLVHSPELDSEQQLTLSQIQNCGAAGQAKGLLV